MKIVVAYLLLIFGLGINYIFNISVARLLGPTNFGNFSYALYLFNIFSLIAVFSLDQAALRFIPQAQNSKEIRVHIQLLAIILSIIFSLIFTLTIFMFVEGERANLAYWFAASIIPFVLLTVNVAILQAEHIVGPRMAFRYVIEPIVKFGIFLLLFYSFQIITAPIIALFIALVVTNISALVVYWNRLGGFEFQLLKTKLSLLIKFIVPMSMSNAVSVLSGRLDLLILGALVAAPDLGHYSAAFQTAGIITIVLQGIETVYAPIFSSHIGSANYSALMLDYQRALRWTMLLSAPLIMIFVIYPELIILPFGAAYQIAAPILAVLCIGQFFLLALGAANPILILLGKAKIVLLISLAYVVLTALLVGVGASYAGTFGAASGVVFAIAITNMIRVYFVFKLTGCHPFSPHYLKILVALMLSVSFGFAEKSYFANSGIFIFPMLLIILVLIFGLHSEDKQAIKRIYLKISKSLMT